MSAPEPVDCRRCGACCKGLLVDVNYEDLDRLYKIGKQRFAIPDPTLPDSLVMRMQPETTGRCVALRGEIGVNASCSIYDHRPDDCRSFEPGSKRCFEWREHLGVS